MIVDQDAHPPHHLPNRSRHGSGTACHDRQALVPPWTPLAHALAHSRGDGHQAQPEGLETIPSRSAQGWALPREARSRLERSVEASIAHVSRAAGCHMAVSALAATARDQTSGGGSKYGKVAKGACVVSVRIPKKNGSVDRGLHTRFQHGTHEVRTQGHSNGDELREALRRCCTPGRSRPITLLVDCTPQGKLTLYYCD